MWTVLLYLLIYLLDRQAPVWVINPLQMAGIYVCISIYSLLQKRLNESIWRETCAEHSQKITEKMITVWAAIWKIMFRWKSVFASQIIFYHFSEENTKKVTCHIFKFLKDIVSDSNHTYITYLKISKINFE